MYASRYNDPLATWGSYSTPSESAQQLHLDAELAAVPYGGEVVDIGAGAGLSVAASIHVRRPDLHITSVDPGFMLIEEAAEEFREGLDNTIELFDDEQQTQLRTSDAWRARLIPGLAEALPLPDASVDLVTSYSCVPHYSPDHAEALAETLRVLKLGGIAINGPMLDADFEEWNAAIQSALEAGAATSCTHWTETLRMTYGPQIDAHFTRIVK